MTAGWKGILLTVLGCAAWIGVVSADELAAIQWLEKMSRAMKEQNFQGTVAFMKNGQLDTMKYFHAVDQGVEQERLLSLNSPMRDVVRKSGEVSCLFKDTKEKVVNHHPVDRSFIVDFPQKLDGLDKTYDFIVLSQEAVAMLPAQVISIAARDDLRYSRKLWIDVQQFLPLKVEVYNLSGEIVEQVVFIDLVRDAQMPVANSDLKDDQLVVKHIHQLRSEPFGNAPFVLKDLPVGFEIVFFTRNSMHKSDHPVDHLLISDGFSSISVYLEATGSKPLTGLQSLGGINSFSRVVADRQITVLGEAPAKTVEQIAMGIELR